MTLSSYLERVEAALKLGNATEHTFRGDLKALLEALQAGITATNEPKRQKCGAPDYQVTKGSLTLGYVEAKDVGVSLDATQNGEQMGRYLPALENLVLTDYLEFRLYVRGELRLEARAGRWNAKNKKLERSKDGMAEVEALLKSFLNQTPQPTTGAQPLAERMAHLTHLIRDVVLGAIVQKELSAELRDLWTAFEKTLVPDLKDADFADMYAQTLAYGLFAARVNHRGPEAFNRIYAAREIPRTNPLLQKLFFTLTGPNMDDEPHVGFVDDLTAVLEHADIGAILEDFGRKTGQGDPIFHFYETFLAAYDPEVRERRGVYYTPKPVVSYIVRSVDALLKQHFGLPGGLGDSSKVQTPEGEKPRVLVLDPATGTGTFLYEVIDLIRERYRTGGNKGMWGAYVQGHLLHALYGFELMMAPYAVAHLKLALQLAAQDLPEAERAGMAHELTGRLGVYLTNTLEDAEKEVTALLGSMSAISDEARAAARIKRELPIMVILGNPPYSGHSSNKGQWMDDLMKGVVRDPQSGKPFRRNKAGRMMAGRLELNLQSISALERLKLEHSYYELHGAPLGEKNPKWLQDDYVKFIRWAQWRIQQTGAGVLAFITPHGYLENPTFRGMRHSLMRTFDEIYVLDLHGNARKKEVSPDGSADKNVFDIMQGVAVGLFVRKPDGPETRAAVVKRADLWGAREAKYETLASSDVLSTTWETLNPQSPFFSFQPRDEDIAREYESGHSLPAVFPVNVMGFQTHRDDFAIAFERAEIEKRVNDLRGSSKSDEVLKEEYGVSDNRDWQLEGARKALRDNVDYAKKIQKVAYRPFDERWAYFGYEFMDYPRRELLEHVAGKENLCLGVGRQGSAVDEDLWSLVTVSSKSMDANIYRRGGVNIFSLYRFPDLHNPLSLVTLPFSPDPSGRAPNLSKAFVVALEGATKLGFGWGRSDLAPAQAFSPEDVLHYVYAVLHAPTYRSRYAAFLKQDFPRIPLPSSAAYFRAMARLGEELTAQHLLSSGRVRALSGFPQSGTNEVAAGYPKFSPDADNPEVGKVMLSPAQWFEGVPLEVWGFRVGGYQPAEKWLKDRRGRRLGFDDILHYQHMLGAMARTLELMEEVEGVYSGLDGAEGGALEGETQAWLDADLSSLGEHPPFEWSAEGEPLVGPVRSAESPIDG